MLPKIQNEIDKLHENNEKIFIEMPTFFEIRGLNYNQEGYYVIHVHAHKDIRIQRVLKRNSHLSIQDVLDRMKTQLNPIEKMKYSNYNIENNKSETELREEVLKLIKCINKEES
jgi:dephospho-CoA kinase